MKSASIIGLVISATGVLVFLGYLLYAQMLLPVAAGLNVTELDRAGVFNEGQLQAFNPSLAGPNLRVRLGPWIANSYQRAIAQATVVGVIVCLLNVILFVLILRVQRQAERTETPQADS